MAISKETPIEVEVPSGDGEAIRFGEEIVNFLLHEGYSISTFAQSMGRPFPKGLIEIQPCPGGINISIGYL